MISTLVAGFAVGVVAHAARLEIWWLTWLAAGVVGLCVTM